MNCSFKLDWRLWNQGVTDLHCFKDSKYNNIFLICAHMARNPYFPVGCKMCLMGDIKVRVYYSSWDNVQVSICTIRILVYVLYETLDLHYKKSMPFLDQEKIQNLLNSERLSTKSTARKTTSINIVEKNVTDYKFRNLLKFNNSH